MTGEFTNYCNYYYHLTRLLAKREARFKNELDNAPLYIGQTKLSEIDAIIAYCRMVQATQAKIFATLNDMTETAQTILKIMAHFEIPPNTILTGIIPEELEYEIWADETDAVHIRKTLDLKPEDNPNIITINIWGPNGRFVEEDED